MLRGQLPFMGFRKYLHNVGAVKDPSRPLLADSKLSCPIEVVTTNKYWFSPSILTGGVVHLTDSASVAAWETVWMLASVKLVLGLPCSLTNGSITPQDRLVWGPWFIALRSILPKSWRRSKLVNMTYSFTVSFNSMTLPTKGWKLEPSSRLSFSTQYCSPLA